MKKILISLTDEQYRRLEELAARMGVTKSEAMRAAVKTFDVVRSANERGEQWKRKSPTGEEVVVEFVN